MVLSTQRAAQASLEWFENLGQYVHQDPLQFAFNILTRSRRVTHDNLRLRDPEFVDRVDRWFAGQARNAASRGASVDAPPMFQPFQLRGLELKNRVIVSAMDMYSAACGTPNDFHLVHLGSKALGGAALVMTEMVCVSAAGRITPGCTGMYAPEHEDGWRRIVEFVHERTTAHIGLQLGHSGRKGSTKLMWEGMDDPLPDGNWPVAGPSAIPYSPLNQVPHELTHAEMEAIRDEFVRAAQAGDRAGFDLLELHCAHGYLLSSFISPLSNQRTDRFGGSLEGRLRYPLEVFDAVRAVWPSHKPMSVRISASDWCEGGIDADDAVAIARAFAEHGADAIDVSTGQVVSDGTAGLRALVPDAVRRSHPQRGGHRHHRRRRDLLVRRRQLPGARGSRGHVRTRPRAPLRPAVDAARGRGPELRRTRDRVARSIQGGQPQTAGRTHRRAEAAAAAHPRRRATHTSRALAARCGRLARTVARHITAPR